MVDFTLQRLRQFHYFLWVLAHGYGNSDPIEDASGSGSGHGMRGGLSAQHFPWVEVVEQLPACPRGQGWLDLTQVVANVPLGLWMLLFKLYGGTGVSGG